MKSWQPIKHPDSHTSSIYLLCLGSLFTCMAVVLQSAPLALPLIGMFLSPCSTLPVALASHIQKSLGIVVFVCTLLILFVFSLQEALIFLCTTGPLGLLAGYPWKTKMFSCFAASFFLMLGILLLSSVTGILHLTELGHQYSLPVVIVALYCFSLLYAALWLWLIRSCISRLTLAIPSIFTKANTRR